jgi:SAM-dependent methyltransferase
MLSHAAAQSDLDFVQRHREIWAGRPELRSVYHGFFDQLLGAVGDRAPVVELGAGPGFFKEYCPGLISTDVINTRWVDVVCDGCAMPFAAGSVGAFVALDVLHHLPRPLDFFTEVSRVLRRGGVLAVIEPWITPASYILYHYFHHEDCRLRIDLSSPFSSAGKNAFDGNSAIPYKLVRHYLRTAQRPLELVRARPFLGLPYLATLGFKRVRPVPAGIVNASQACEKVLGIVGRWNATRALLVWEKQA